MRCEIFCDEESNWKLKTIIDEIEQMIKISAETISKHNLCTESRHVDEIVTPAARNFVRRAQLAGRNETLLEFTIRIL